MATAAHSLPRCCCGNALQLHKRVLSSSSILWRLSLTPAAMRCGTGGAPSRTPRRPGGWQTFHCSSLPLRCGGCLPAHSGTCQAAVAAAAAAHGQMLSLALAMHPSVVHPALQARLAVHRDMSGDPLHRPGLSTSFQVIVRLRFHFHYCAGSPGGIPRHERRLAAPPGLAPGHAQGLAQRGCRSVCGCCQSCQTAAGGVRRTKPHSLGLQVRC